MTKRRSAKRRLIKRRPAETRSTHARTRETGTASIRCHTRIAERVPAASRTCKIMRRETCTGEATRSASRTEMRGAGAAAERVPLTITDCRACIRRAGTQRPSSERTGAAAALESTAASGHVSHASRTCEAAVGASVHPIMSRRRTAAKSAATATETSATAAETSTATAPKTSTAAAETTATAAVKPSTTVEATPATAVKTTAAAPMRPATATAAVSGECRGRRYGKTRENSKCNERPGNKKIESAHDPPRLDPGKR